VITALDFTNLIDVRAHHGLECCTTRTRIKGLASNARGSRYGHVGQIVTHGYKLAHAKARTLTGAGLPDFVGCIECIILVAMRRQHIRTSLGLSSPLHGSCGWVVTNAGERKERVQLSLAQIGAQRLIEVCIGEPQIAIRVDF